MTDVTTVFIGPGVARRAAYHAYNHQVKEWLRNGERGPPPSEYTTAAMAAAASSRRGAGGDYKRTAPVETKAKGGILKSSVEDIFYRLASEGPSLLTARRRRGQIMVGARWNAQALASRAKDFWDYGVRCPVLSALPGAQRAARCSARCPVVTLLPFPHLFSARRGTSSPMGRPRRLR
jgi:hypothetical protein